MIKLDRRVGKDRRVWEDDTGDLEYYIVSIWGDRGIVDRPILHSVPCKIVVLYWRSQTYTGEVLRPQRLHYHNSIPRKFSTNLVLGTPGEGSLTLIPRICSPKCVGTRENRKSEGTTFLYHKEGRSPTSGMVYWFRRPQYSNLKGRRS